MVKIKPHGGFVNLYNNFDHIYKLLKKNVDVNLKTDKKKTYFTARASMLIPAGYKAKRNAIIILRRTKKGGKVGSLQEVATCFKCCWGHYYSGYAEGIGMYCKALDEWAKSIKRNG